jgi:hypothetical protein
MVEWSKKLGMRHAGVFDLNQHWYGPAQQVRDVARHVAMHAATFYKRAFDNELPPSASASSSSSLSSSLTMSSMLAGWPLWHRGAALDYLAQMALNHVAPELSPSSQLGVPAHRRQSIRKVVTYDSCCCFCLYTCIHRYSQPVFVLFPRIQCFRTTQFFSRYAFDIGHYNALNMSEWDTTDVRVFALVMALRGAGRQALDAYIEVYPDSGVERPLIPSAALKAPQLSIHSIKQSARCFVNIVCRLFVCMCVLIHIFLSI